MIVYEATKKKFVDDFIDQTIIDSLVKNYSIKGYLLEK